MSTDQRAKETVTKTWLGVFVGLGIVGAVVYVLWVRGPERVPPPVNQTRALEFELQEGCELRVSHPGGRAEVVSRPERGAMVVGDLEDGAHLDFTSVRVDWVELEGPVEGWVDRRYVSEWCP